MEFSIFDTTLRDGSRRPDFHVRAENSMAAVESLCWTSLSPASYRFTRNLEGVRA